MVSMINSAGSSLRRGRAISWIKYATCRADGTDFGPRFFGVSAIRMAALTCLQRREIVDESVHLLRKNAPSVLAALQRSESARGARFSQTESCRRRAAVSRLRLGRTADPGIPVTYPQAAEIINSTIFWVDAGPIPAFPR